MHQELWLPVPQAEGRYEISSLGRVRSLVRQKPYYLRPFPQTRYLSVLICYSPAHRRIRKIHQLVLEAFVGPRPVGYVGCHNNDQQHDNRVENLRWDTQAGNLADIPHNKGVIRKVHIDQARQIKADPRPAKVIAAEMGFHRTTVRSIQVGRAWAFL